VQKRTTSRKKIKLAIKTPSFWKKFLPVIPTIILLAGAILLKFFPKSEEVVIQFKTDRIVFVSDFGDDQKFDLMKAIPVKSIGLINPCPIKVSFQRLWVLKDDSTHQLLKENSTVEFTPEVQHYSEFRLFDGDIKLATLEIGRHAIVDIELRDKLLANKVKIEVREYPAKVHVQLAVDSTKILADRCVVIDNQGVQINQTEAVCQRYYLFIPWEVEPISKIVAIDNEIIVNLDFSDSLLATKVFETGKHGIPIRKLGFSSADVNPFVIENVIQAICTELQVAGKIRNEFMEKPIFCRAKDFERFRIDRISLQPGLGGKINLVLKAYTNKLHIGLTEGSIRNVLPSILEYLASSPWTTVAAILGWLITTTLAVYGTLRLARRKK